MNKTFSEKSLSERLTEKDLECKCSEDTTECEYHAQAPMQEYIAVNGTEAIALLGELLNGER